MFRADSVLFMLAGVLCLWGVSLVVRGAWGDRAGGRYRCPACGKGVEARAHRCAGCGFESSRERDFRSPVQHWGMVAGGAIATVLSPLAFLVGLGIRRWAYTGESYDFVPEASPLAAVGAGVVAFGLVVLVRGLYGTSPGGRRRCPSCWYDMEGAPGLVCPECGHDAREKRDLYRRRRRPRLAWAGTFIVLLGMASFVIPMVRRNGWASLVPSVALIAGLEDLPDRLVGTGARGWREDTLLNRVRSNRLRAWERDWLISRCRRIAGTTSSRESLTRATLLAWNDDGTEEIVIDRLLAGLVSPNAEERSACARLFAGYLWSLIEPAEETRGRIQNAAGILASAASDESAVVAEGATLMLRWADSEAENIARTLLDLTSLGRPAPGAAVHSLFFVAARHEVVRGLLLERLDSADSRERLIAFLALGGIGTPWDALSHLDRCAPVPDAMEEGTVHSAGVILNYLDSIGQQATLPALDGEPVRGAIMRAAPGIRQDLLAPHIPRLIRALASGRPQTRADAAGDLQGIAETTGLDLSAARAALEALAAAPGTNDARAARAALDAISKR